MRIKNRACHAGTSNPKEMDLTNCEVGKWYPVIRTNTMSQKTKIRLAHLGLNKEVKVLKRNPKGAIIVKTSRNKRSNPLVLGHWLGALIIVEENKNFDGNAAGKNLRGY